MKINKKQKDTTTILNWESLYNSNKLNKIYVSWNPSIHNNRKTHHFSLEPQSISSDSIFDNSLFNCYKKTQILVSLSPHPEPNETRIILEHHRKEYKGVLYEIRCKLYAFDKFRLSLPNECFKSLEVREDEQKDIISDTMIFEENNVQDNYILTIEAIPLAHLTSVFPKTYDYYNKNDPICAIKAPKKKMKYIDCEVNNFGETEKWNDPLMMSLTLYSWFETEIVEVPFKEVTQMLKMTLSDLSRKQFKLKILEPCDLEIRIDGHERSKYAIKISKFSKYKNSFYNIKNDAYNSNKINQKKNIFLANNSVFKRRANNLFFKGKIGSFQVQFDEKPIDSKNNGFDDELNNLINYFYSGEKRNSVTLTITAFSETLHRTYRSSMSKIKLAPLYKQKVSLYKMESRFIEKERFKFELPQKGGLRFKKEVSGEWNSKNNFSDNKFNIMSYQKFHQNPGFVIHLNEDTQFQISVNVSNYKNDKCLYKLNIFEITDNYNLENVLDYDDYISFSNLITDVIFLSKNKNGYLFLLFACFPDFYSSFKINIQTDLEIASIKDNSQGICKLPWIEKFQGYIRPNCGGWIKNQNFLFNQSFIIILGDQIPDQNEEIFIELSSNDKIHHIGVSVISLQNIKSLIEIDQQEIEAVKTNHAFLAEMNSYYLNVPQGIYMVIPTTFEPLEKLDELYYDFKFFSSVGFKFKKLDPFIPLQKIEEQITMRDQMIYQLDLHSSDVQLLVIIQSLATDDHKNQYLDLIARKKLIN